MEKWAAKFTRKSLTVVKYIAADDSAIAGLQLKLMSALSKLGRAIPTVKPTFGATRGYLCWHERLWSWRSHQARRVLPMRGTGMGEQMLSRECYYLGTQLPIDRFLTFYYGHPGFHIKNMLVILAVQGFFVTSASFLVAKRGL